MIVKKHITRDGRLILAVCDSDIKGKCFNEDNKQLDLSSDFYNGEEMKEDQILKLIKAAYIINLVGKKSITLGLKLKIIEKGNVIKIKGIPHAQGVIVTEE